MHFSISILALSAALASATEVAPAAAADAPPSPVAQICSDFLNRCMQDGDPCSTFCRNAETNEIISVYEKFCLKVEDEWTCSGKQPNPGT